MTFQSITYTPRLPQSNNMMYSVLALAILSTYSAVFVDAGPEACETPGVVTYCSTRWCGKAGSAVYYCKDNRISGDCGNNSCFYVDWGPNVGIWADCAGEPDWGDECPRP